MAKIFQTCIVTLVLALPLSAITAKSALADDLVFSLINKANSNLTEFYVSPTGIDDWEEDILGIDVLSSGEYTNVTIADGRSVCTYDIKGVFDDGEESVRYKVNLCQLKNYTFYDE